MNDAKFLNGLIVKAPHENAPDFVKCKLSLKRDELISSLAAENGDWINLQVKVSQGGKWYAQVDEWKPDQGGQSQQSAQQQSNVPEPNFLDDFSDDIPFARPHDEYFG